MLSIILGPVYISMKIPPIEKQWRQLYDYKLQQVLRSKRKKKNILNWEGNKPISRANSGGKTIQVEETGRRNGGKVV